MTDVFVIGSASQTGLRDGEAMNTAVHRTVLGALHAAGLDVLDGIDIVVTVGSDIIDGGMGRSGIAGAYGRGFVNVPSSAGHGFAAAVALIESGEAKTVLLVGWGEASKFLTIDGRAAQADPFYARPLGADARVLSLLHAQRLVATGILDPAAAIRYVDTMRNRHPESNSHVSMSDDGIWLKTSWCDGASALVLSSIASESAVMVRDFGIASQPYCPEPDQFDPADWLGAAIQNMRDPIDFGIRSLASIEISAPTPYCELAAARSLLTGLGWTSTDERLNSTGGGSLACFGPATGLRHIAMAAGAARNVSVGRSSGLGSLAVDLYGPLGQAVTVVALEPYGSVH